MAFGGANEMYVHQFHTNSCRIIFATSIGGHRATLRGRRGSDAEFGRSLPLDFPKSVDETGDPTQ